MNKSGLSAPFESTSRAMVQANVALGAGLKPPGQGAGDAQNGENRERHALIANAAYLRAEGRQFEPGHEVEDWLAAEIELQLARPVNVGGELS